MLINDPRQHFADFPLSLRVIGRFAYARAEVADDDE